MPAAHTFCLAAASCAALLSFALPVLAAEDYATESLLRDVERIVDAEESADWFTDEDAYLALRSDLMNSVCRSPQASRFRAVEVLRARVDAAGNAQALHASKGGQLDGEVERARFVGRQLWVLERAVAAAAETCPFWVHVESQFPGRQSDRDRWTLGLESGGNAQLRHTEGTWTIGAGGLARVLVGYGFGGDVSLLAGAEFGGGAMLKPEVKPTEFVVNYFPAVPIVLRFRRISWHYDLEVAPVALFQADDGSSSFGFRTGVGIGISGLRRRNLVPWAGVVAAYEYYFEGTRPSAHFLRGGVRVGVSWDFATSD